MGLFSKSKCTLSGAWAALLFAAAAAHVSVRSLVPLADAKRRSFAAAPRQLVLGSDSRPSFATCSWRHRAAHPHPQILQRARTWQKGTATLR